MMIYKNSLAFGKRYIGQAPVKNNLTDKKEYLDFVEYNNTNDLCHVYNTAVNWQKSRTGGNLALQIARDMEKDFKNKSQNIKYYGFEGDYGKVQAVCEVQTKKTNYGDVKKKKISQEIRYMEVCPKNVHGMHSRKYSLIGTSLFKEILKLAQKDEVKFIDIVDISGGFWEKIPFLKSGHDDLVIWNRDYDKCIKKLDEII